MKFVRALAGIGIVGVIGALVLPVGDVAAVINDNIELQGEEFQIAISPAYVEFNLTPGSTTGERFRVRNVGSQETDLKIGIAPLEFSSETTMLGTPRNEIVDWTTITLEPGCEVTRVEDGAIFVHMRVKEECYVKFSTKTPSNAPFGEQYMNMFFQEYRDDEGSVQAIRSIGVNIFGTNATGATGGEGDACAKVINQSIPFWLFEGPLKTTVEIENCGRLNFHASVKIEVYNIFGSLVYEDAEPQDRIVAAESKRKTSDSWIDAGMGIYKTKQTVTALGETYEIEKWTFIIPIWLVIVILLCIAVVIFTIVHDRKKKKMKRAGGK
ncbi:hypothetical protein FWF89_01845 [Candidatus Saccharibacteria bacterium]|nr:hypothetical protein [Candidatus Saccharibacteria bacterium]